jgi:maleylacetoacetate isomerase
MSRPVLYDYYRSSASYRVRIALNLKGIAYDSVPVNLAAGEQKEADYRSRNAQGFVPMLEMDGHRISQSLAIIHYLDSVHGEPPLAPEDAGDRAHVIAMALTIACDIHPLNNLRVLKYLVGPLGQEEAAKTEWIGHWIREGFAALQAMAEPKAGRFLFGDTPSLADICLVPQLYNARRFEVPLHDFPLLVAVEGETQRLEAFAAAHPDRVAPTASAG